MNEENTVVSGEKPRKKKRSLWWLWFLLILAAFAGGIMLGLKINTLPLPTEFRARVYPILESYIPGSTTPRTPDDIAVTPEPTAEPEPVETPEPVAEPEPAATPEPTEEPAEAPEPTVMPEPVAAAAPELAETPAPAAEETPVPTEAPAPVETLAPVAAMTDAPVVKSSDEPEKKFIGVGAALEIALNHAGVAETDAEIGGVYRTKNEEGEPVYEVSFKSGDNGYAYVIGALDGEIEGWKVSGFTFSDTATFAADFAGNDKAETAFIEETAAPAETAEPVPAAAERISEDEAKAIAYKHAAVKAGEVVRTEVELREDADAVFYIVEFKTASRRFSYEIDALTGEVLVNEVIK